MKKYELTIKETKYEVVIKELGAKTAKVNVNGKPFDVAIAFDNSQPVFTPPPPRQAVASRAVEQAAPVPAADTGGDGTAIKAPMPGLILKIFVSVGDSVSVGQKIVLMEAMKMENDINSTVAGVVKSVQIKEGDNVKEHQALIIIG